MEQKNGDDVLCAKLHLVNLAGSERAKRTGVDGMRLKEGIHINKGLLTLGNVISALGDERKRKEGDTNVEETLNTLKYENHARNIQNKAIINRDPIGAQQQRLQSRIDQLEAELLCFKGLGGGSLEEIQILKHKVSLLKASRFLLFSNSSKKFQLNSTTLSMTKKIIPNLLPNQPCIER
ncbi:hypothetical protein RYX36_020367 [Vicia faba]